MGFAVLHINKGSGSGAALGRHNDRTQNVLNADPSKAKLNFKIVNNASAPLGTGEPLEKIIKDRIKEGYKGEKAIRRDAVKYLNIILSGSHEEMTTIFKDTEKAKAWIKANYIFISQKYGKENIAGFYMHRDEKTPHIHAVVVPLTKDGRLTAKEVMGTKIKFKKLQDEYAQAMSSAGFGDSLTRGVKGSKAKHTDVNWYYGKVNEAKEKELLKTAKNDKSQKRDFGMGM